MMLNEHEYRMAICHLYGDMAVEDLENDKITDNAEWEKADRATAEKFMPRIQALERTLEAILHSSQPSNEWFAGFCKSLRRGQRLTTAQMECFERYAKAEQYTRYKTPVTTYRAIIDGVLYTVQSMMRQVYIEPLTLL